MKLILQQNIANLGRIGDEVTVKAGYARNFLIPQDKAIVATKGNIELFELRRSELEKLAGDRVQKAEQRSRDIQALSVTITSKASEEGKLFGSVGPREVALAVSDLGQDLKKNEVSMPNGPIRLVGQTPVMIQLHTDVSFELMVNVVALD